MIIKVFLTCYSHCGSVVERNDYYPLGMRTSTDNSYPQLTTNLYKYNGKEVQTVGGLGFTDYGARMYDDFTGRWFVPDPLAEETVWSSPFSFNQNNPINRIDLTGRKDNPVYDTFKRQPLHSLQLEFCHPITGTPMCLMAPVPEDMSNAF